MIPVGAGAERLTQAMRALEAAYLIGVDGVTEIWLVRHGDCYQDMADGDDPPLSALGRHQAERLAERAKRARLGAVYSSPYRRALETAKAITDDVHIDRRLVEMELELTNEGGFEFVEKPDRVIERMSSAIDAIAAAHPRQRVIAVTHGAAIVAYLTHVLRLEPGQLRLLPYYTSVTVIRALGDRRMVGGLADLAHLE
jgi:broad specificity phosphatase PhoE